MQNLARATCFYCYRGTCKVRSPVTNRASAFRFSQRTRHGVHHSETKQRETYTDRAGIGTHVISIPIPMCYLLCHAIPFCFIYTWFLGCKPGGSKDVSQVYLLIYCVRCNMLALNTRFCVMADLLFHLSCQYHQT